MFLNEPNAMRKFIFCLPLLFLLGESFAQVSGGLKGGLNLSKQKWEIEYLGESASQTINGASFHVGGYLQYTLSETVLFQPELIYNGLKFDQDGEEISLGYLSLPLMFGYGVENNRLIFQAGPQVGMLLSSDPKEIKDDDGFKDIDLSLNFGAMFNLSKFNLSVRYSLGLLNITGDGLENELEAAFGEDINLSIKNNNLQFSVGYRLFGN